MIITLNIADPIMARLKRQAERQIVGDMRFDG